MKQEKGTRKNAFETSSWITNSIQRPEYTALGRIWANLWCGNQHTLPRNCPPLQKPASEMIFHPRHWHSCYSDYFLTLDWTRLQSIFNFWNRSTVSLAQICFCSCAALIVMIVALMEWRSCASNGTKGTPAKKKRPKKTNRPNDQQTKNNLVIPWKVKVKLWVNAGSQSFSSNK